MPSAGAMGSLGAQIVEAAEAIAASREYRKAEVGELMLQFEQDSRARRAEVRNLAAEVERLMAEVQELMAHFARLGDARKAEARGLKAEVRAMKTEVKGLMAYFARLGDARKAEVQAIKTEAKELVATVRELMAGLAAETGEGRAEWQRQKAAIAAARGVAAQPVPPVARAAPEVAPPVTRAEEEVPAEAGEVEPALADRLLTFISQHPGSKLTTIEEEFGISRIAAGRIVRDLMDQGKVRRDDETREYHAV